VVSSRIGNERPVKNVVTDARPAWTNGLVLVCRECDGDAKRLRRRFKDALDEIGARKRVRVVECGCVDLCPKRATAIVTAGAGGTRCAVVRGKTADAGDLRPLVARFDDRHL